MSTTVITAKSIPLSDNSIAVLKRRYLRKGRDGEPIESVEGMFHRVASHIASAETQHGGNVEQVEETFYRLLTDLRFFPNSPTFTGAGTPLGQLAACFVLPIEDDMGKEESGIFQTLRDAALIQQTGGGNGFGFSRLRPKGDFVKASAGRATGPVGFLRVYDQAFGEVAQGGCLTPDTLIFTEKGLLRLDEIVTHNIPGWESHILTVATDEGARTSTETYNNGIAPTLRVKTSEGIEITGTPNHKVKVMMADGIQWCQFQDLQPGDAVMVKLGQHQGNTQTLSHPIREHGNQIMPTLPTILNEELAFFLGYFAGDGFVAAEDDDYRISVSVAHTSYLIGEMPRMLARLFGEQIAVSSYQKEDDASLTYVIHNRAIKEFLQLNGLAKSDSTAVCVPRLIRQSDPAIVGAYLSGLFEADGALAHHYPELVSASEGLLREVATLLIGLGCPVRLAAVPESENRYGTAQMWRLRITSHVGLEAWRAWIGCHEKSRFIACFDFEPDLSRESTYSLPNPRYWLNPVLDAITLPQIDAKERGQNVNFRATEPAFRKKLLRYVRGERQFTMSAYVNLRENHTVFADMAEPVADRWFVTVESVEEAGEQLTLDLEVEGNHTYLANGLVTHNTRRGANMAVLRVDHPDIFEFVACKANEYAITNFNISVGITDKFMQAVADDTDFDLINPRDGAVWRTIQARTLFDEIIKYAYNNGEPGLLFLDEANRTNPVPHLYELEATNPCITGDTLVYTANGIQRADALADLGQPDGVVVDGRFGVETLQPSSGLFSTGMKDVYRVTTHEGYELRLTANHQVMTTKGWVEAGDLQPNDVVHILNRPGAFGMEGSRELGLVLGWLVGDGTVNQVRAVLSFFGQEKIEVAPMMAEAVTALVDVDGYSKHPTRRYPVGLTDIAERDEVRIQSDRLRLLIAEHGLHEEKLQVPDVILRGCEASQQAFLQAMFAADGTVNDGGNKGCSVRLTSVSYELLQDVQRLLLNFGIASRIYRERRSAGMRSLPDGKGGYREYWCRAYHELAISKDNLIRFAERIGFLTEAKQTALLDYLSRMTRGSYKEDFTARVASIEYDGREMVYDLSQPTTNSFIANGFVVHNCGEQWLGPYENCCLGSVNLAQHVTDDNEVDWELLQRSVEEATHFLDNVVTINNYVPSVPQLREAAHRARRIGLGIMGLADMMYHLGVRYGSEEGQAFAGQIMEFVRYHCMKTSIQLAQRRGAFPAIEGSIYDPNNLVWEIPTALVSSPKSWNRPTIDWQQLRADLLTHGIRNCAQTTVAPTGTIATVTGCEGYGCEPVFALAYVRHVNDHGKDLQLQYTSPTFEKALIDAGLEESKRDAIIQKVNAMGGCQEVEELPAEIRDVFVVSADVTPDEHVRMQAAIQAFVDNSISKTCNFPPTATQEDVARAYKLAWELGCKGLTVYVTGSRDKVVLETHATKAKKEEKAEPQLPLWHDPKKPRATVLKGETHRIGTPLGTTYVTVNENGGDQPFEVFMQTAKAGSDTAAVSEAIGRLISFALRMPSPISPRDRLKEVVNQLGGIGGGRPLGFGPNRVLSLPDGIARVLNSYLNKADATPKKASLNGHHKNGLPPAFKIGDLCPDCGEAAFVREEGCRKCYSCSYSEC